MYAHVWQIRLLFFKFCCTVGNIVLNVYICTYGGGVSGNRKSHGDGFMPMKVRLDGFYRSDAALQSEHDKHKDMS